MNSGQPISHRPSLPQGPKKKKGNEEGGGGLPTNTVVTEAAVRAPGRAIHIAGEAALADHILPLHSVGDLHGGHGILLVRLRSSWDDPRVHKGGGKKGPKDLEEHHSRNDGDRW